MKFLLLFILLPFFAFAESGVTNNLKIAGNLQTSKNIVNGSFESGANTGWTVGAGTLTATTAQKVQGAQSGLWSITGAGTIDLCATPTNLANSDLVASGWVKSTSTDLQVCSVINSVENGCSPIGSVTGWKKVQASGTYASGNFCFRLKSVASGAITAYVDDVKLEPLENQQVSTVEQEAVTLTGYTSGLNPIVFSTIQTNKSNSVLSKTSNSRVSFLKSGNFSAIVGGGNSSTPPIFRITLYNSLGAVKYYTEGRANTVAKSTAPLTGNAEIGDYIEAQVDASTGLGAELVFSITAIAVRDNVIQSWQAPADIGEIKYLPQNIAPQGFLPANGSIIGLSSGSHQGAAYLDLYRVLWQVAQTTAGEPYVISSAKGSTADADWAAAKTIKIDESGLFTRAYLSGTSGAVGAKQLDALQNSSYSLNIYASTGGTTPGGLVNYGSDRSGNPYATLSPLDTTRTASETRPTNVAKYAFIRFASSQPTLLALPVSKDNNKTYDKSLVAVTGTGWTTTNAEFHPYRTISKVTGSPVWRMAFNIIGTTTSATRTSYSVTIAGVTFPSSGQTITAMGGSALTVHYISYTGVNNGVLNTYHGSATTAEYEFSGDVELASKPTWCDEWIEPGVFVGNVPLNWTYPLTVTATNGSTGFTAGECFGTVEKTGDGKYWLNFTITGIATAIARTEMNLLVAGATVTTGGKAISWFTYPFQSTGFAYWQGDGGVITIGHPLAAIQDYTFSGRVLLASKPVWAVNTP